MHGPFIIFIYLRTINLLFFGILLSETVTVVPIGRLKYLRVQRKCKHLKKALVCIIAQHQRAKRKYVAANNSLSRASVSVNKLPEYRQSSALPVAYA